MFLVPPKDRTIRSDKRRTLKERRFRGRNAHSGKCRAILYLRLESEIDSVSRGSLCFILHAKFLETSSLPPPDPKRRGKRGRIGEKKMLSTSLVNLGNYGTTFSRIARRRSGLHRYLQVNSNELNIYNAIIAWPGKFSTSEVSLQW